MCDAMNVIDKLNEEFDEVQNKNIELEKQLREKDRQLESYKSELNFRRLQSDFNSTLSPMQCDPMNVGIFIDNNLQFIKDNNILGPCKDDLEEYEYHCKIIDQRKNDPEFSVKAYYYDNIQGLLDELSMPLKIWFTHGEKHWLEKNKPEVL
jgi:hypothetical protein